MVHATTIAQNFLTILKAAMKPANVSVVVAWACALSVAIGFLFLGCSPV
jgi:hypothetical protein